MIYIAMAIMSAVVLLGMAKKTENRWRQLSLMSAGKAAVNLQKPGETVLPSEMYFGSAACISTIYDLDRLLASTGENGWINDQADVLIIEDGRPSKTALMVTSKPLIRFFTGIAAKCIDEGAVSSERKVVADLIEGVIDVVQLDSGQMPIFELGKGDKKFSPYFVIDRSETNVEDA
jgi:hypothetical protein